MKKIIVLSAIFILLGLNVFAGDLSRFSGTWVGRGEDGTIWEEARIVITVADEVLRIRGIFPDSEILSRGETDGDWPLTFSSGRAGEDDLIITAVPRLSSEDQLPLPFVVCLKLISGNQLRLQVLGTRYSWGTLPDQVRTGIEASVATIECRKVE